MQITHRPKKKGKQNARLGYILMLRPEQQHLAETIAIPSDYN